MGTCSANECDRPTQAKGYCSAHYQRYRKGQDVNAPMRKRREGWMSCSVDGCASPSLARQLCQMHYWRWWARGEVGGVDSERPGKEARYTLRNGYVLLHLPDYPTADPRGYILEHRYVMEQVLGRLLRTFESVHHINGIRHDNRADNLELWARPQPTGQRPEDLVEWVVQHYPDLVMDRLADSPR